MARTVNSKFIPTDILSKRLTATSSIGENKTVMKIDQVDQFEMSGSIASFIRIQLNNDKEEVQDSFFFTLDEVMELKWAFLQTTEGNIKLLEWEMALIQSDSDMNCFIITLSREYFQKELGYSDFRILES